MQKYNLLKWALKLTEKLQIEQSNQFKEKADELKKARSLLKKLEAKF